MTSETDPHEGEPELHVQDTAGRLNWLRAGVLGANDGIVSTAGLVIGVAAATTNRGAIFTAGLAGLAAGAMSMAVGEYVSVSTQRDTEQALLAIERRELREDPEAELQELAGLYQGKGLEAGLAMEVAQALTRKDALAAHAEAELGIDPHALTKPWQAAVASFASFTLGALLPLIAVLNGSANAALRRMGIEPKEERADEILMFAGLARELKLKVAAFQHVLEGYKVAGTIAEITVPAGGVAAMAVTYLIGRLFGTAVGG